MRDNHELSKPPLRGWKFFFFKYVHGKEEPVFTFRYRLLLRHTPFFNFFWDIFFDGRPPGQNEVKDILNMLGLLNALLLTTAVSLMASVNTDELEKADARWTDTSTGYGQYWTYWYAVPPSNQFYFDVCMVLCMFFIGVVGVVWVFADTIGKTGNARDIEYWQDFYKFKDELEKGTVKFGTDHVSHSTLNGKSHEDSKLEGLLLQSSVRLAFDKFRREQHDRQDAKAIMEGTQKGDNAGPKKGPYGSDTTGAVAYDMSYERKIRMTSDTVFQIYWGWAKYCVFMQITTTIFGCIYAVFTCNVLFAIKYPDYWIAVHGVMSPSPTCPTGYSNYFFKGVFGVVAISTVLFTGIGTAAKYTIEEAKRSEVLTKIDANNTAKAVVAAVSQAKPSPLPLPDDAGTGTKVLAFDADDASTDAKGHV